MNKGETRIEKYQEYRLSFLKSGVKEVSEFDSSSAIPSTLPLDSVMSEVSMIDQNILDYKKQKSHEKVINITLIAVSVVIIIITVILGIVIF